MSHLRLVGKDELPQILPVRYVNIGKRVMEVWATKLDGRNFIGSYFWEFPYDPSQTTTEVIGRLLISQNAVGDSLTDIDYSIQRVSKLRGKERSLVSYLGITSPSAMRESAA